MISKKVLVSLIHRLHKPKPSQEEKFLRGLLVLGGLLLAILLFKLIWSSYAGQAVAAMLPREKTTFYFEMQNRELPYKLRGSALEGWLLSDPLLKFFGIETRLLPGWAKENIGMALVQDEPLIFFRATSRRQALKAFKEMTLKGEKLENRGSKEFPIYMYPQSQNFVFAFAGPYLFLAQRASLLEAIHSTFQGQTAALIDDPEFKKTIADLPKKNWIQGTVDLKSIASPGGPYAALFATLQDLAYQLSFTVRQTQNGFHFNTFLGLNPEFLALRQAPLKSSRFTYGLSEIIPSEDLAFYLGGLNLSADWENTLGTLNELNPAYGILLEGVLRAQIIRLLGPSVNLEEDIYPLFQGEYAFLAHQPKDGPLGIALLLTHNDLNGVTAKLQKLHEGFKLLAAQFTPRIKTVILPDGTTSRELVADPEGLETLQENYKGITIDCIEVKASVYGFCYGVTDELVILSNHLSGVRLTLDAKAKPEKALVQNHSFREALSNLSKASDEITFADLGKISTLFAARRWASVLSPYLNELDSTTWVKHRFDDGVSTEGFILIK